jgi:hypothetical protein
MDILLIFFGIHAYFDREFYNYSKKIERAKKLIIEENLL